MYILFDYKTIKKYGMNMLGSEAAYIIRLSKIYDGSERWTDIWAIRNVQI